ncbi:helix-turn-helix domain-containing protein [Lysinibacillus fusiformis]|uniref:helix-turn-helix domain-containing protein n=1 Tax=Lysinibacillus fusiformis TaxID=28031 RepID=UPI003D08ECF8
MLNLEQVGAYISFLRKKKDWTQVELANLVGVSHQAVSKWERGESLPDIGVLILLSKVFEVSIDNLLLNSIQESSERGVREDNELTFNFDMDNLLELLNNTKIDVNDLLDISPLVKPSKLSEFILSMDISQIPLEKLIRFAPFIQQTVLEEKIKNYNPNEITKDDLVLLAPFISKKVFLIILNDMRMSKELGLEFVDLLIEALNIAPYHMEEELTEIVSIYKDKISWDVLVSLAPFLEQNTLFDLISEKQNEGDLPINKNIFIKLVPFITKEQVRKILFSDYIVFKEISEILMFIPFIDLETLKYLIDGLSTKITKQDLLVLSALLDEDSFKKLMEGTKEEN